MASTTECITSTFIEAALNVYRNMLVHNKCMQLLQSMDEKWTPSPLNSIYKLQIVVSKAEKAEHLMLGYLNYINDACETQDELHLHVDLACATHSPDLEITQPSNSQACNAPIHFAWKVIY